MSTPEQKIAALEVEIAELGEERKNARGDEKNTIGNMITAKENRLSELLKAQAAAAGNAPPVTHFVLCAPLLLFLYRHVLSLYCISEQVLVVAPKQV